MPIVIAVLVIGLQATAGAVWWAWVRRSASVGVIELAGMGLAIGSLTCLMGAQATTILGLGGWGWLVPVAFAGLLVVLRRLGRLSLATVVADDRWRWVAVLVSVSIGMLALVPSILRTPLMGGYLVGDTYNGDLVFLEALSQSLARFGPGDSTLLAGEGIRYHWFSYAWVGSLTEVSGAGPFVVMTRMFPVAVLIGVACLAVAWAGRLSRVRWVPLMSSLLVVVGGYVGAAQGVVLTYDSPSTAYSALVALAFGLLLTEVLTEPLGTAIGWRSWLTVFLLALGTLGSKASQAAVIAAGIALLVLASFWYERPLRRRVWAFAGVSAAAMVIGYLALLAGVSGSDTNISVNSTQEHASTFQGLDPFAGTLGVALGTAALILGILPRWLGVTWLLRDRSTRFAPVTVFSVGLGLAGLTTIVVLRSGTNAAWFALASSALIGVVSAAGLGEALEAVGWRRPSATGVATWRDPIVLAAVAAGVISGVVLIAYALTSVTGANVLWRGPVFAWLLASAIALGLAALRPLSGPRLLRWAAMLTTILMLTSVLGRLSGSMLWGLLHSRATPIVQDFVRLLDPSAQFPGAQAPVREARSAVRGVAAADSVTPLSDDTRGAAEGVARTGSIIQWSPAMNEAAAWLGSQAGPGQLVAIDDQLRQPFLPIMSRIPTYLSGLPYTAGYTTTSGATQIPLREAQVSGFLAAPSADTKAPLLAAGVHWLWLVGTGPDRLEAVRVWAPVAFSNAEVTILRLNGPGASSG